MSGVSLVVLLPLVVIAAGVLFALAGAVLLAATALGERDAIAASVAGRAAFVGLRWLVPTGVLWLFVAALVD
jgi:hypothetical protein